MLAQQAKLFWIAFRRLSFLSQQPLYSESPEKLGQSAIYFPPVGFIFGLGFSGVYFISAKILPDEFTCLLILLLMGLRSGGRSAGDFMETVKSLAEKAPVLNRFWLEAVSGPRVWGFAGLVGLLTVKYLSLLHIGGGWVYPILVLSPTLSAWSRVYLSHSLAFTSMAHLPALNELRFVKMKEFWVATVFTTLAAGLFMELSGLFILLFVALVTAVVEKLFLVKRLLEVEPSFGAVLELNEVVTLVVAIAIRTLFFYAGGEGVWL